MQIKSEQWMLLEDNEDGTVTMNFRIKIEDRFETATVLIEMSLLEALAGGAGAADPEWTKKLLDQVTEVPDSPELA